MDPLSIGLAFALGFATLFLIFWLFFTGDGK
jgi:hypothetical protein